MKLRIIRTSADIRAALMRRVLNRVKTPKLIAQLANCDPNDFHQIIRDEVVNLVQKMFYKYFLLMNLVFGLIGIIAGFIAGIIIA